MIFILYTKRKETEKDSEKLNNMENIMYRQVRRKKMMETLLIFDISNWEDPVFFKTKHLFMLDLYIVFF